MKKLHFFSSFFLLFFMVQTLPVTTYFEYIVTLGGYHPWQDPRHRVDSHAAGHHL